MLYPMNFLSDRDILLYFNCSYYSKLFLFKNRKENKVIPIKLDTEKPVIDDWTSLLNACRILRFCDTMD